MYLKVVFTFIKYLIIILSLILMFVHPVFSKNLGPLPELLKPSMIDVFQDDLYIVDSSIIHVYSLKDLKLKRKFGKIGEGPGEYRTLPHLSIKISVLSDFVLVESLDKVVYFTRDGKYLKEKKKPFQLNFLYPIGDRFVARKFSQTGTKEPSYSIVSIYNSKLEEIKELFREWLATEFPDRAARVIHLLQSMHGGQDYRSEYGIRQRGSGPYAKQIAVRFRLAAKRLGLNRHRHGLRTDLFVPPVLAGQQMRLF